VQDVLGKAGHDKAAVGDGEPIALDDLEDALRADQNQEVALALGTFNDLVPYFDRRFWQLMRAADPVFLTSDVPIQIMDLAPDSRGPYGIGYATADLAMMPLNPQHLLVMWAQDKHKVPGGSLRQIFDLRSADAMRLTGIWALTSYD
jgi:hypothetical protein